MDQILKTTALLGFYFQKYTGEEKKTYAGKLFKEKVINEKAIYFCFVNFFRLAYEGMAFTMASYYI